MKKIILQCVALSLLSGLSLLCSDYCSDEELRDVKRRTPSFEEEQMMENRLKSTWKKVFNHMTSELYEEFQEQSNEIIVEFIALSSERKDGEGRKLSIFSRDDVSQQQFFKSFVSTILQQTAQPSESIQEQCIEPQLKKDTGEKDSEYPDSVWL